MRYLHPVGAHEVFVGSGTYVTRQGGVVTGAPEHWTIHELPDGAWFIRVDRDGREVDGRSELIEAWRSPIDEGGQIERFDVVASNKVGDVPRRAQVTYSRMGEQVSVGRSLDSDERVFDEVDIPLGVGVQPGAYVFIGALLAGDVSSVLWRYGIDRGYVADVGTVSVVRGESVSLHISGREHEALLYDGGWLLNLGGVSGNVVRYWVDSHGIMLQCAVGELVVTLERYSFRR